MTPNWEMNINIRKHFVPTIMSFANNVGMTHSDAKGSFNLYVIHLASFRPDSQLFQCNMSGIPFALKHIGIRSGCNWKRTQALKVTDQNYWNFLNHLLSLIFDSLKNVSSNMCGQYLLWLTIWTVFQEGTTSLAKDMMVGTKCLRMLMFISWFSVVWLKANCARNIYIWKINW